MTKALERFYTDEIEAFLDSGDYCELFKLLESAVAEAKRSHDGIATVQFFITYEPDEAEASEATKDD